MMRSVGKERSLHLINYEKTKLPLLKDLKKHAHLYLMMTPFFLTFFVMTIISIGAAIWFSFTYYNLFETPTFIGLQNYINLFLHDEIFAVAMRNTLLFSIITGPISYILCFYLAWLINEFGNTSRVVLTFCFYAPALTGASIFFVWQFLFSGDAYGFINGILQNMGFINEPVQWLTDTRYNFGVMIVVQLWMSLGTGFLAFIAGFKGIDRTLYEAGSIDGIRGRMQELFYITIPSMKPQLLFGAIMQISVSFSVSTLSTQLLGANSTNYSGHTIVLHMIDYGTIRYEMGYACAIAVVLFIIMLIIKTLVTFILKYVSND
jgi:multiple sugar transport system permease protein